MQDSTLAALYEVATDEDAAILDHLAVKAGIAPETGTRRIPLRGRSGVTGWTVVDADMYEELSALNWFMMSRGYACRNRTDRKGAELMHRRILGLDLGDGRHADHINRNRLDNRRENLRIVTQSENNQNTPGGFGLSGVSGVHWDSRAGRWMARVTHEGTLHHLGYFDTIEAAATVSAEWRRINVPFSPEASTS